jgi:hypothetical protein
MAMTVIALGTRREKEEVHVEVSKSVSSRTKRADRSCSLAAA